MSSIQGLGNDDGLNNDNDSIAEGMAQDDNDTVRSSLMIPSTPLRTPGTPLEVPATPINDNDNSRSNRVPRSLGLNSPIIPGTPLHAQQQQQQQELGNDASSQLQEQGPLEAIEEEGQVVPSSQPAEGAVVPPPRFPRGGGLLSATGSSEQTVVVRGTDIHVPTASAAFQKFILEFVSLEHSQRQFERAMNNENDEIDVDDMSDEDKGEQTPHYMRQIQTLLENHMSEDGLTSADTVPMALSLNIDTQHLYYHSPECQKLYHQLVNFPRQVVPLMDILLNQLAKQNFGADTELPELQVRPHHLKSLNQMRALDPASIETLISLKGMVVRTSPIIPDLKVAHFRCTICGHNNPVTIDHGGRVQEPLQCPSCSVKNGYELIHNASLYGDKQMVRIQETPDQVPAGETPASVLLFCFDDLVDAVRPGDRIEVTGVLVAQSKRVNPKITKLKSVYRTYLDVIHFSKISIGSSKLNHTSASTDLSDERVEELHTLSKDPFIYEKLVQSLAPSIWELQDVKKGVLAMLFGGTMQDKKRGDINILLCGDPGTSKSQLLSFVHKLSPRGVYTSGKGSSAVGLTASIVRDPETRDLVLESGALVLSDLGICCIDEFDKMSDTTRAILHEAMEQQTVSIAKAGIIATLRARTSILASANPLESRYNPQLSVVENIQLPPTLLSRFDLIYLILDSPHVDTDRQLAQHLVGLYYETPHVVSPPLDIPLLKDYIAYARQNIHPKLTQDATEELLESYLEMRRAGMGSNTIAATPRQLESMVRLSEGLAKMKFSSEVKREDVKEAVRLVRVATQAAATDPRTGRIDMDMIATGKSQANREMEESLFTHLKELLAERKGNRMTVGEVRKQLTEIMNIQTLSQSELDNVLKNMEADGWIQFNERSQSIFVRSRPAS